MRTSLLAVLLFSCTYHTFEPCPRMPLIISDSIPVQFWVNGEETFNEKDVCGIVKQDCFCQLFNDTDEVTIQFQHDTNGTFLLRVSDTSDKSLIAEETYFGNDFVFTEIVTGIYQASLTPLDFNLSGKMKFTIVKDPKNYLSGYDNYNIGEATDWTLGSAPSVTVSSPNNSNLLIGLFPGLANTEYSFFFDGTKTGFSDLTITFYDAALNQTGTAIFTSNVSTLTQFSLTSGAEAPAYIGLSVTSFVGSSTVTINSLINLDNDDNDIATSDCIDIQSAHECTTLIEYENTSDFDGIEYESVSPGPSFQLRIPAIFFEEENPQEQEDLELSNGVIVTLRQSIVEKRKLETGFMPNYMHRKLQKILMHDSVYIDGDYWKKRDAYDTSPVKKYNLKTASVLLTKYDSVEKNTI